LTKPQGIKWLQEHLDDVVAPLLGEPCVLDADVTVKPLYGHQEGAVVGDNGLTGWSRCRHGDFSRYQSGGRCGHETVASR
jgi:hypothetical protein